MTAAEEKLTAWETEQDVTETCSNFLVSLGMCVNKFISFMQK